MKGERWRQAGKDERKKREEQREEERKRAEGRRAAETRVREVPDEEREIEGTLGRTEGKG